MVKVKTSPWQRGVNPNLSGWYQCKGEEFTEGPIVWRYWKARTRSWAWNTNKQGVDLDHVPQEDKRALTRAAVFESDYWRGVL